VRCAKETADPHDRGVVIVGQGLVLDSRTPKPQMYFSRPQSFVMSAEPEARELSVLVVMGVSGAGKSTIAALPKDPRAGAARIPQRTAPGSFLSPSAQKQRPYNLFNRRCIMCDYSLQDVKSRPAVSLRETCEQGGVTIREFNRIVMGIKRLLVDLPENRCGVARTAPPPTKETAMCDAESVWKSDLSPG
jgi:hypothetical protein